MTAIYAELYVAVRSPSLESGFPRLTEKFSQLWNERAVEDAPPGEEGEAVKLECQECGRVAQTSRGLGAVGVRVCVCVCGCMFRSRQGHHFKDDA